MRHRLRTILSTLSLLLFVATVVLWVRSRTLIDYLQWTDHRRFPGLVSSDGRIIYSYQFWSNGVGGNEPGLGFGSRPGDPPYWGPSAYEFGRNHFAGFEWSPAAGIQPKSSFTSIKSFPTPTTYLVSVPHWFLCLLAFLPVLMWIRNWCRRSQGAGRCSFCGYDLRATPARCPECGAVPAKAPA